MEHTSVFDSEYADRIAIRERIEEQNGKRITRTKLMNLCNLSKARLDKAIESEKDAGQIKETKIETAGRPRIEYERTHAT